MPRQTKVLKWQFVSRISDGALKELATKLAGQEGKDKPEDSEFKRAEQLLRERAQFKVLMLIDESRESTWLWRALEQQNFSIAAINSLEDAQGLISEANLFIVGKEVANPAGLNDIRKQHNFERLPIIVFSELPKPKNLEHVDWMPTPPFDELINRVVHSCSTWKSNTLINAFGNPLDALLTDIMINCDRLKANTKPDNALEKLIEQQFRTFREHTPIDLSRFGSAALYFARTKRTGAVEVPGLEKWSGISTDFVYTLDMLSPKSRSQKSETYCFKFFKDEERARVEIAALEELNQRDEKGKDLEKTMAVPIRAPKLLIKNMLTYVAGGSEKEYYVCQEFIRGPMLYSLMPEVIKKAREKNYFAEIFRKVVAFVKNEQLAYLQINEIPLPEEKGFRRIDTNYAKKISENLTENAGFFRARINPQAVSCLDACIGALFSGLRVEENVQYFDFNDTNLLLDIDMDRRATLSTVEAEFLESLGNSALPTYTIGDVKKFTSQRMRKVDYNKIFRRTNIVEDTAHEFSYTDWSDEERSLLDVHFLLCRKKENLRNQFNQKKQHDLLKEWEKTKNLIERLEGGDVSESELSTIARDMGGDYSRFKHARPFIQFYRTIRWLGHVLRRYVPEHRQIMEYAGEQMKLLCGDKYQQLFGEKRNFASMEKEISKHLQRESHLERRHFLCKGMFSSENASESIRGALGDRLDDFVSSANRYESAYQDLHHDLDHLGFYFKRAGEILGEIIQVNVQKLNDGAFFEIPLIEDADGNFKYEGIVNMLKADAGKGNQEAYSRLQVLSAHYLRNTLTALSDAGIDYRKLSRAGVKE